MRHFDLEYQINKENDKLSFHGWSETEYAIVSIKDKNVYFPKMRKKELKNLLLDF